MKPSFIPLIFATLTVPAFSQLTDAPPVDMKQLLQGLRQFKDQNEASLKSRRSLAYKQVVTAATSNESAAAFWSNAVQAVRFNGVDRQASAVRDWTKTEGEGLKVKEGANAARLSLVWLGLTIQHANDAETSKLLPNIIDYTKQLEADDVAIGHLAERVKKTLERSPALRASAGAKLDDPRSLDQLEKHLDGMASGGKSVPGLKDALEDVRAKKFHDSTLKTAVSSTEVVQSLQIADLLGDSGKKKKKGEDGGAGWEAVPGNVNGIYTAIILPEFRDTKDPRLLDYWDMMLRKGQEGIYAGMPAFEERQWSQVNKPATLWSRAQDMFLLGLKNRSITEMFNLIKAYPQHPDAPRWISQFEGILTPPASAPVTSALQNGTSVAPPTTIPPATAPGAPPTAIIVPATPAGVR